MRKASRRTFHTIYKDAKETGREASELLCWSLYQPDHSAVITSKLSKAVTHKRTGSHPAQIKQANTEGMLHFCCRGHSIKSKQARHWLSVCIGLRIRVIILLLGYIVSWRFQLVQGRASESKENHTVGSKQALRTQPATSHSGGLGQGKYLALEGDAWVKIIVSVRAHRALPLCQASVKCSICRMFLFFMFYYFCFLQTF